MTLKCSVKIILEFSIENLHSLLHIVVTDIEMFTEHYKTCIFHTTRYRDTKYQIQIFKIILSYFLLNYLFYVVSDFNAINDHYYIAL